MKFIFTLLISFQWLMNGTYAWAFSELDVENEKPLNAAYIDNMIMKEHAGINNYKKQNFALAYKNLSYAAKLGFKQSQYLLSVMYMKGQHVEQSLFYAMAWLGVAKESKATDWMELYENIYNNSSLEQQQAITQNTAKFIKKYGMKKQHITCSKRARLGARKKIFECTKNARRLDIPRADVRNPYNPRR